MAGKLSGPSQRVMESLLEAQRKWSRVHSLVEQVAGARTGQDMYLTMIWRAASDVNRIFMSAGQGTLADQSNQLAMVVRRGGKLESKLGVMRELVANVGTGIERAMKQVERSDQQQGESK